jgi:AraC-like DNA-binding protein
MVYPWLDLAPFDLTLGIGPLLYLYLSRLTSTSMAARWKLHLFPVAVQGLIYSLLFVQPMTFKNWFEDHIGPTFNKTENLFEATSMVAYMWLSWRVYRAYENGLKNRYSDPDANRLRFLRTGLLLISGTLTAFAGAKVWGLLVHSLSYFQMFPFYVMLTLVVYAFGFVAFQFADIELTVITEPQPAKPTDWAEVAAMYTLRLESSTFWKDPMLSISTAAQALDTAEGKLSKAINSGLGISFSEWINQYRIEQVASQLTTSTGEQTILEIAFDCGFNSKATFNRWFRQVKGCTPTEFRKACEPIGMRAPKSHPVPPQ